MQQNINKSIEKKILLNPGPATTSTKVKSSLVVEDICPREKEFGLLLDSVRSKIKKVVNADDSYESILLGCSGTGAIESCLTSCVNTMNTMNVDSMKKNKILIIENGAYGKRMEDICQAFNISYHTLKFKWGESIDFSKVDEFLKNNHQDFRVLAIIHHETTTGMLNPIENAILLAQKYELVSLVDAMSSYAGIDVDFSKIKPDYFVSSSNKCIHGMAGIGIVIAKLSELLKIQHFKTPNYYFNLYKNFVSQKEKKQFLFTPPVQILYALNAALDEFFDEGGIEVRSEKYRKYYQLILDEMCSLGFKPLLDKEKNSGILTTFHFPTSLTYSFDELHDYLYQKGITIYPGKVTTEDTFRISNIGDLDEVSINFFIENIKEFIQNKR